MSRSNGNGRRATAPVGESLKTPPQSPPLRVPAHGNGKLRVGGTNRGGGRLPDAFKGLCRQLASGEMTVQQVEAILRDANHPQFMAALRWATEHGYGKPKETVEHQGAVDVGPQVWEFGKRRITF